MRGRIDVTQPPRFLLLPVLVFTEAGPLKADICNATTCKVATGGPIQPDDPGTFRRDDVDIGGTARQRFSVELPHDLFSEAPGPTFGLSALPPPVLRVRSEAG